MLLVLIPVMGISDSIAIACAQAQIVYLTIAVVISKYASYFVRHSNKPQLLSQSFVIVAVIPHDDGGNAPQLLWQHPTSMQGMLAGQAMLVTIHA